MEIEKNLPPMKKLTAFIIILKSIQVYYYPPFLS